MRHPLLSQPAQWGSLTLPNRMIMPPMGTHPAHSDGTLSHNGLDDLLVRARGGAGLLITESMPIQTSYDLITGSVMGLSHDHQVEPLQRAVAAVHREGALIAANLTPGFGRLMPMAPDGGTPWSASDNPTLADPAVRCRELSTWQVEDLLELFASGVRRAVACGFDAIDLHGHTGDLTDQFLTAAWNRRADRFGGDVAGCATFAAEMIRIVRQEAGADFPLSMRLTVRHEFAGCRDLAEARELAVLLQDAGLDVLVVDAGDGVDLSAAAAVKSVLRIPVAVAGSLAPELGEQALRDGIADFIGFEDLVAAAL